MDDWKIGFAEGDITPGKGPSLMSGYGFERYAQGMASRLRAQALALEDKKGRRVLWLTADILGFDPCGVATLRRALERQHGLTAEAVMLSASHTHWAPAIHYRVNFTAGGVDMWFRKRMEEKLLELATAALGDLQPGRIGYSALETRIGINRRLPDGKGGVKWAPYPEGSYDTHTPILHFERRGKISQIVLVSHACHPTSCGMNVSKWNADYPGFLRERIQKSLGAGARGMFMMGCGGEAKVSHRDAKTGQEIFANAPEESRAAGQKLAEVALEHLQTKSWEALDSSLSFRRATGGLRFARAMKQTAIEEMAYDGSKSYVDAAWARQSLAYPDTRKECSYEVQAWKLGETLTILGLEGEVCSPLGPVARALAKTRHAMALAYVNADQGYIPSRRIVIEGGYEGEGSHRAYFLPAPFTTSVEREFKAIVKHAVG